VYKLPFENSKLIIDDHKNEDDRDVNDQNNNLYIFCVNQLYEKYISMIVF
jgi:hypothetical protein